MIDRCLGWIFFILGQTFTKSFVCPARDVFLFLSDEILVRVCMVFNFC